MPKKRTIIAQGYIDYYICGEADCLKIGVISMNGEEYDIPGDEVYEKVKGTKGRLVWEEF